MIFLTTPSSQIWPEHFPKRIGLMDYLTYKKINDKLSYFFIAFHNWYFWTWVVLMNEKLSRVEKNYFLYHQRKLARSLTSKNLRRMMILSREFPFFILNYKKARTSVLIVFATSSALQHLRMFVQSLGNKSTWPSHLVALLWCGIIIWPLQSPLWLPLLGALCLLATCFLGAPPCLVAQTQAGGTPGHMSQLVSPR